MGERETCFLSLFMHFIQEISTKEIQTITDSSHNEQSTRNIDCHRRCTYFCWEAAQTKTSVIFSKMCVLSFFIRKLLYCNSTRKRMMQCFRTDYPSGIFVLSNNFKQVTGNAVRCQCPLIHTVTKNLKSWTA